MTHDIDNETDRELEAFFQDLRAETEEPSSDLLARVLADAYEEQDSFEPVEAPAVVTPVSPPRGFLGGLLDAIGGWPAMAGLATATVAGIWIGYNPPAVFDDLTLTLMEGSYGYSASADADLLEFDTLLADG